jgi:hypothetical protein
MKKEIWSYQMYSKKCNLYDLRNQNINTAASKIVFFFIVVLSQFDEVPESSIMDDRFAVSLGK